ncbi:NAD(P)-dependent oxidoreductase [Nakamurella sp. A5-74]|uniref:NAD(P)-dependent oxidoreductase n=1 Tax=Nakamurella sp. A5-74 TaxID=3158264 RepID=A0AAU8DSK3_9ACTN
MTDRPLDRDAGTSPMITWVVGAHGLLGSSLVRCLTAHGGDVFTVHTPWSDPASAGQVLRRAAGELIGRAAAGGLRWRFVWCAGAGVTGTSADALLQEVAQLQVILDTLADEIDARGVDAATGAAFVASSAGGVYAGSESPPFTETHPVAPRSDYGRAKLAAEECARGFADRTGVPTVVGRITNLYGPGQNLAKPQGLISHLALAHLNRTAITMWAPLDTIRDYLFVEDCADMVRAALDGAAGAVGIAGNPVVKIFGSQQATTIGALIGEFRRVFKRSPRVVLGSADAAKGQASDLRVRSIVWIELDARPMTSLPAGVAATAEDLLRSVQHAD